MDAAARRIASRRIYYGPGKKRDTGNNKTFLILILILSSQYSIVHNAEKCRPILKFLSPLDSAVTLQQSFVFPTLALCALLNHIKSALENITIFSKISKYRKYTKYHDIFYIFDIFQKTKISSKLYNNGCNTLMQYSMTISYQSFVPYYGTNDW